MASVQQLPNLIAFHRTELAHQLVQALQGKLLFSDAKSGLFLTAPRRTGKTTFLRFDLTPALEEAGALVVYVDLWENQERDPAELILEAIGQAVQAQQGIVARTARKAGLSKVKIGGALEIDTGQLGSIQGLTLKEALRTLHELSGRPVALIVDEAQQALSSQAGEVAMMGLKSARDQLNTPSEIHLMLVMSGSDRDKLMRLTNTNSAPFYGSTVHPLPPLGIEFIQLVARRIEEERPGIKPVDIETLHQAFEAFGHRPQRFMDALGAVLNPVAVLAGRFEGALMEVAKQQAREEEARMASEYLSFSPLQQAVLWRLLDKGSLFKAYDADALAFYTAQVGRKVTAQQVQTALDALRALSPSPVWKSQRGDYAVDDLAMHRWYDARVAAGTWPPRPGPGPR